MRPQEWSRAHWPAQYGLGRRWSEPDARYRTTPAFRDAKQLLLKAELTIAGGGTALRRSAFLNQLDARSQGPHEPADRSGMS